MYKVLTEERLNEIIHDNIGFADVWCEQDYVYVDLGEDVGYETHIDLDRLMGMCGYLKVETDIECAEEDEVGFWLQATHKYVNINTLCKNKFEKQKGEL